MKFNIAFLALVFALCALHSAAAPVPAPLASGGGAAIASGKCPSMYRRLMHSEQPPANCPRLMKRLPLGRFRIPGLSGLGRGASSAVRGRPAGAAALAERPALPAVPARPAGAPVAPLTEGGALARPAGAPPVTPVTNPAAAGTKGGMGSMKPTKLDYAMMGGSMLMMGMPGSQASTAPTSNTGGGGGGGRPSS